MKTSPAASHAYRFCFLDMEGHIVESCTVQCADDLAALEQAEGECLGHPVEVWQGSRFVARVKANNAPLSAADPRSL